MIKPYLSKVINRNNLSTNEAQEAMTIIMTGQATPAQIGAYLAALRVKGESVEEIAGSAKAMRSVVKSVTINLNGDALIDTAGTGGDGSNSFNISTAAAFVIAGAGHKVAKHGNRAASSRCGSADVLEAMGINLDLTPEQVGLCINKVGIGFMFAPNFHPAMRHAIGPRRELGHRTIFNLLGPLTNPAGATHQIIGVFDPALTDKLAQVLADLGTKAAFVFHGFGGLDELTTSGPNEVSHLVDGVVTSYQLDVKYLDLRMATDDDIAGGEPIDNAVMMEKLLSGKDQSPLRDVVLLNAAAALAVEDGDLKNGLGEAIQSLNSGAAITKLEDLVEMSQSFVTG